jgi:hypothetical protein
MDESLLTSARRVVRYFNIDMNKGGLVSEETQQAVETLDRMVRIESEKEKRALRVVEKGETK